MSSIASPAYCTPHGRFNRMLISRYFTTFSVRSQFTHGIRGTYGIAPLRKKVLASRSFYGSLASCGAGDLTIACRKRHF